MEHINTQLPHSSRKRVRLSNEDYKVACLVPLGVELAPLRAMLDAIHDDLPAQRDQNAYVLGQLGEHNVVIAVLPSIGNNDSGVVANQLMNDFPSIRLGLLVGIAGGIPDPQRKIDIRLGDVIVSEPDGTTGGVVQFDRGKRHVGDSFELTGHLNKPSPLLIATVKKLKAQHMQEGNQIQQFMSDMLRRNSQMNNVFGRPGLEDQLFQSDYEHVGGQTCGKCDVTRIIQRSRRPDNQIKIHYGTIGSSNTLIKNAAERDRLGRKYNMLSVEMEAAGLMDTFPCLVIRGVCDYADSHKNKIWQPYAAAAAAAYAKELLQAVPATKASKSAHVPVRGGDSNPQLRTLLESLTFDRMDARLRNISEALSKTCKWLFSHDDFQCWIHRDRVEEHHGILWIKGKPGSGKSTMMKNTLGWAMKSWPHEIILSYFFNARAPGELENSSLGLYRSLLYQLLCACPQLHDPFLKQFASKDRNESVDEWTTAELKVFLEKSVWHLLDRPINIFVDALDEGIEDDVRQVLAFLEDLASDTSLCGSRLRICLASRHFPNMSVRKSLSLIMEDQQGHEDDIRRYIRTKLKGEENIQMKAFQDEIYQKSARIFLWVVLVVRMLNKVYDKGRGIKHMMKCLESIPKELDDLFAQILAQNDEDLHECVLLLQWVLFSKHALNAVQLDLAIKSSLMPPSYNREKLSAHSLRLYLLNTSRGLTELTKSQPPTVQFIHETVRDFLERRGLAQIDPSLTENVVGLSHERLKTGCLQYIEMCASWISDKSRSKSKSNQKEDEAKIVDTLPFIKYAAGHLFLHADAAEGCGVSQRDFMRRLRGDNHPTLQHWTRARNAFEKFNVRKYTTKVHLLYVVVEQNLENLVEVLINDAVAINVHGERFGSALQAACAIGSERIVERLIVAGADTTAICGEFDHALFTAIHFKKESVMHLLSQKRTGLSKSALQARLFTTIARGYLLGVQILLKVGASIEKENGRGATPLIVAVQKNHIDITRWLIEKGANVNRMASNVLPKSGAVTTETRYTTALQVACEKGHEEMVHLLIDQGANINVPGKVWASPLYITCKEGHEKIARVLLDRGADINIKGKGHGNALHAACEKGHEQIVRLLVEFGADTNARSENYNTALHAASEQGHIRIVRFLIERGTNVNFLGGKRPTALYLACEKGYEQIVRLLIEGGANVNIECGYHGHALQAACVGGHEQIVRHLIEKRADINAEGGHYGTALQAACAVGHEKLAYLLIEKGADIDKGGEFGALPFEFIMKDAMRE